MRIYHNIWLKDVGERSSRDCLATLKSVVFFILRAMRHFEGCKAAWSMTGFAFLKMSC